MVLLSDYIFYDSWLLKELNLTVGQLYIATKNVGKISKGEAIRFEGFDDIDNHYGILVFTCNGEIREINGDFSGPDHYSANEVRNSLSQL